MAELLLARTVSGATSFSSSAKICCLSGSFSGAASNTKVGDGLQSLSERDAHVRCRLIYRHTVSSGGEQISDAVAHQAAAHDSDLFAGSLTCCSFHMLTPIFLPKSGTCRGVSPEL